MITKKITHVTSGYPNITNPCGGAEFACKNVVDMMGGDVIVHQPKTLLAKVWFHALSIYFPFSIFKYFWFKREFKKRGTEIVHLHKFDRHSFGVVLAAKHLGLKVVMSIYDYWIFCPRDNFFTKWGKPCFEKSVEKCFECYRPKGCNYPVIFNFPLYFRQLFIDHFLKKIDKFVVLSENSKNILCRNGICDDKIEIIPPVVPLETKISLRVQRVFKRMPKSVLFVGWGTKNKGFDIYKQIEQQANFYCQSFGGPGRRVNHDVILKALHLFEVLVIPEQWENMCPIIMVEGMRSGIKIVASRIGGIPEYLPRWTATHDVTQSFIAQIESAFESPATDYTEALKKFDLDVLNIKWGKLYGKLF